MATTRPPQTPSAARRARSHPRARGRRTLGSPSTSPTERAIWQAVAGFLLCAGILILVAALVGR